MGKYKPCPIPNPNPAPGVAALDVQCMELPQSTTERLQVPNVGLSFGQGHALIPAQKVREH